MKPKVGSFAYTRDAKRRPEGPMRGGVDYTLPTTLPATFVARGVTRPLCAADVVLCISKVGLHNLFFGLSGTVRRNLRTTKDGFFARQLQIYRRRLAKLERLERYVSNADGTLLGATVKLLG